MIEALFCSGNYVFSFAQLLQILVCINIGDRVELIPRPGQRLCADAAAASARATELIVYLLSPLPTPRTPQPGLSSIHDHNRHHLRFYREKSFGHQMVACMTRITLKLNKRKRKLDWVDIYSFMMQQSVPSHKISSLLK